MKVPELLSPAGSLEKLKVAVLYGANAVYLGGQKFGLRTASDNFTEDELVEGVEFAHKRGVLVYVVLNSFLHDKDIEELPEFIEFLKFIKVDAVIVSDLGVLKIVKELSDIPIHLSTQASCLNLDAVKMWTKLGAKRIIAGRELSISEASLIKHKLPHVELELFIHGSMCMSYSGHCVISNYTQGRDSNRGGCAHSCRFEYSFQEEAEKLKAYFMSSKDLSGIRVLEEFIKAGIDSVKIEGRMKSNIYAGTVSKVYSEALKFYAGNGHFISENLKLWEAELNKMSHRDYTLGNLIEPASDDSIFSERESCKSELDEWIVAGTVIDIDKESNFMIVEVKNHFNLTDILEIVPFSHSPKEISFKKIVSIDGEEILKTRPSTLVKLPYVEHAEQFNFIRKKNEKVLV